MERFVKYKKGAFVGRRALLQSKKDGGLTRFIYSEVAAEDADVHGGEPVFDGNKVVGVTTSGGRGHTVKKSLAFAFVDPILASPVAAARARISDVMNLCTRTLPQPFTMRSALTCIRYSGLVI
jgi:glycine cleavage system aminomethyltransferase T